MEKARAATPSVPAGLLSIANCPPSIHPITSIASATSIIMADLFKNVFGGSKDAQPAGQPESGTSALFWLQQQSMDRC